MVHGYSAIDYSYIPRLLEMNVDFNKKYNTSHLGRHEQWMSDTLRD